MLVGHAFKKQTFRNQIFALFVDTFLNGKNGISNNYKNGMAITHTTSTLTVQSGAICIQGRFLEEDTSTDIVAGTNTAYCKLVIEIDLDKQNTETEFAQGEYKIIKSTSSYPALTQTNIVKNNAGIYQYELARFKTGINGITDFQDKRTFLDFKTIYEEIKNEIRKIKTEELNLLNEIHPIGSIYISVDNTNPSQLFGGTWVQIKDRFLLAAGNAYTAGKIGGEAKHILTENEMCEHRHHTYSNLVAVQGGGSYTVPSVSSATPADSFTNKTGKGEAFNIMPPYLAVYMWKRTA